MACAAIDEVVSLALAATLALVRVERSKSHHGKV